MRQLELLQSFCCDLKWHGIAKAFTMVVCEKGMTANTFDQDCFSICSSSDTVVCHLLTCLVTHKNFSLLSYVEEILKSTDVHNASYSPICERSKAASDSASLLVSSTKLRSSVKLVLRSLHSWLFSNVNCAKSLRNWLFSEE